MGVIAQFPSHELFPKNISYYIIEILFCTIALCHLHQSTFFRLYILYFLLRMLHSVSIVLTYHKIEVHVNSFHKFHPCIFGFFYYTVHCISWHIILMILFHFVLWSFTLTLISGVYQLASFNSLFAIFAVLKDTLNAVSMFSFRSLHLFPTCPSCLASF